MRPSSRSIAAVVLLVTLGCTAPEEPTPAVAAPAPVATPADDWEADLLAYRAERENRLTAEYGWLSLVGLDWLAPGPNRVGAAPDADVRLPPAVSPAHVATLHLGDDGVVRLEAVAGAPLLVDGETARPRPIATDADPEPTEFQVGDLRFHVIVRGDRIGVRSRWPRATTRETFPGLTWYPPAPSFRIVGRLVRDPEPTGIDVPNVLGQTETSLSPGVVVFELDGAERALRPVVDSETDRSLFFVFRDRTAGETTYPAGRFLYADLADDDTVVLDFNRAYSPPCAFTRYATCPLPPPDNVLDVAVEAGERYDGHDGGGHAVPELETSAEGTGPRRASESSTS